MYLKTLLMVLSFSLAASAETWYYNPTAYSDNDVKTPFGTQVSVWTNASGVAAKQSADIKGSVLVVPDGVQLNISGNMTCPAAEMHLGENDPTTPAIFHHSSGTISGINMKWHNGIIKSQTYRGGDANIQPWTITVDGTEDGMKHLWCYYKKLNTDHPSNYNIPWGVSGTFIGDEKQVVMFKLIDGTCTSDPSTIQQFPLTGDNTSWLGQFSVSDCAKFALGHENAAGNPDVSREDAILLGSHARFAVGIGVTPNSARGIKITGEDVRFLACTFPAGLKDCTDYTLNMPICGTSGFLKVGPGRVVLGGKYTAGAISVEEGTLEILASAEIPQKTAITVKSGATLILHHSAANSTTYNLEVTQEEGANVKRIADTVEIEFDADAATATPVELFDDFLAVADDVRFSLSQPIPLPQHEPAQIKIMTYKGEKTLTPEMFADLTGKTFGLPKTSVTVAAEDGVQSVNLNMRPVVVSVADITHAANMNINGSAETWSDKKVPHEGADYVLTNKYSSYQGKANVKFEGDSLTLSCSEYNSEAADNLLLLTSEGPVTVYPPYTLIQGYSGSRNHNIRGKLFIHGEYDDETAFTFQSTYNDPNRILSGSTRGSACLCADVSGAGTLKMTARRHTALSGLTGDNSAYKGRITMTGHNDDNLSFGMRVRVNNANNFGGELDEFKFDALTLSRYAFLYPLNDVAVPDNMNRGWYVNNAGVECQGGITFSCDWPLRINGKFCKIGAGTLRLGGPVSYGADGTGASGTMEVREGRLALLSDASAAGLSVVFSNNTSFAVGCGLATGLTVAPSVLTDDGSAGKVALAFDEDSIPEDAGDSISAVVATLPAENADIREMFNLSGRVSRYVSFSLEKKTVEIDSIPCDVYELKGSIKGLTICIR